MDMSDAQLTELTDKYLRALGGAEIIEALKMHCKRSGVNLEYINLIGSDRIVVDKVLTAISAQGKLESFLRIVREEGYIIEFSPQAYVGINLDVSSYRKWLAGETEYIDIRGIGSKRVENPIVFPILSLYTDLYVHKGLGNIDLEEGRVKGGQRVKLSEMVRASRCLAIMGDPGTGKTTFLRFVARTLAFDLSSPLPFLIGLGDLYQFAKQRNLQLNTNILIDYCTDVSNREGLKLTRDGLERLAQEGKCLWLFDSLDELPSTESRELIVQVVEKATRRWDQCKFILTSRPLPPRERFVQIGFDLVSIGEWGYEEVRIFLENWTQLLLVDSTEEARKHHWGELFSTILDRPDLRLLARNPVMLTAMAVVHYNERRLPEGRAELLESVILWLIRARSQGIRGTRSPKFIEDRYRELALTMFEAEGGRRNRFGKLSAANKISKHFDGGVDEALEFLLYGETEIGVLIGRGEGDLAFWHLSFQEYLAAKEIAGKLDDEETGWWAKIKPNLDTPEWREVLIFVVACLNRLGTERVDLFFDRLSESCRSSNLETRARRVALGGSILRDLQSTGYEPTNVQSWLNILADVSPIFTVEGQGISLESRYDAAVAYGLGGDSRLRDFDETWVDIPGGTFLMGAQVENPDAPNFDLDAARWEGPVVEVTLAAFQMRKYPITVEEYAHFVLDRGYEQEEFWSPEAIEWLQEQRITSPLDWEKQLLKPNCPITGLSAYEADAYCEWLTSNALEKYKYRLPTEAEREYATRRTLTEKFPWGAHVTKSEKAEANCAWSGLRRKTPVGMFPKSTTPDGLADLFGNVEEWCKDIWTANHRDYPNGQIEEKDRNVNPRRVTKGGSTIRFMRLCRATYRTKILSKGRYHTVGFRPVRIR
jgi:formylglycine-generating enzyme required for sulfatase activity